MTCCSISRSGVNHFSQAARLRPKRARVVLRGVPYVGPAGVAPLPGAEGGVEDVGHFIERVRLLCQNVFFTSHLKAP